MESRNKEEAEKMIEEQKVPASVQAQRRQEIAPGLHEQDRFGRSDDEGTGDYYPEGDLIDAGKAPAAGGPLQQDTEPDEGFTGIGNRKPRHEQPSEEELGRDTVDQR